jgi:hypothetical protein
MPWKGPEHDGDFPSLGYLIGDWIARHCVVPDGFAARSPFVLSIEQLTFVVHHYRLKLTARLGQLAPAFHYRRSQLVRPQKWGKNPLVASQICAESVGPVLFGGWARGDEAWVCAEHGCECGWTYEYAAGEPMAMGWPTPLIQITATSEDQTDNTYDALRPMIDNGPLHSVIPKTGEEFIRLPNEGRIDVVTSNARSRLGQRVTFCPQDETGLWTPVTGMVKVAHTQRRGLAGMGGRSVEMTNAWDPAEMSLAQQTYESTAPDIYKDYRVPPANLSYRNKVERRKIHRFNYEGSPWVDIDSIEGEAAELLEYDPAQAERFFGNRLVAGAGSAFDIDRWADLVEIKSAAEKSLITLGVKGARFSDALAIVATDVVTGHQWPIGIWERPPIADEDYEHPTREIDGAMTEAFERFEPWRAYADPQHIEFLVDAWRGRWGDKRVIEWFTSRPRQIAYAVRAYRSAQTAGDLSHDGDSVFARHIANARKQPLNVKDDEGRPMWSIQKERPGSPLQIAAAVAGVLSWEARGDAIAAGAKKKRRGKALFL